MTKLKKEYIKLNLYNVQKISNTENLNLKKFYPLFSTYLFKL